MVAGVGKKRLAGAREDGAPAGTERKELEEHNEEEESKDKDKGESQNAPKKAKLREKREEALPGDMMRPVKLSRAELYKPPTNEELNQLKETENLFHSSLLRMQIEELLTEVKLKEKRKKSIDGFLHDLNTLLSRIPETQETEASCSGQLSVWVGHLYFLCLLTFLWLLKDGYVFRLQVAYHREPLLMKESITPEGMMKYQDTEESLQLEMEILHLPYLSGTLHGLQQQHPAFSGTSRLAKRWICAQMLSDGMSDECMDLLVAYLFLHPAPFTPPSSPQVGFLRFLQLMATFDWKNNPLIVNLNGDIKDIDYAEIKNDFMAARSRLPVMFIATPKDRKDSFWTRDRPSALILQRLIMLSLESVNTLEKQLMDPLGSHDVKMVFRPPLDLYDVLIHLNSRQIPRHREAVDKPVKSFVRGMLKKSASVKSFYFPVVDYDPVQSYLEELRAAFGELALFCYDAHGGEVIGVLWKPLAFEPQPFKTTNVKGRMMAFRTNKTVMVPNVEAILEDFETLGEGLVLSVEARTEKWSI
uniref:Nucleolar protein 6 n=1 Tax=Geotrypetes seraphini TaxID=260995 RepID=A0A6P8S801_GEOSA|nr:nucleolar protein 6 [Geotrypetes seraphini]